MTATRLNPVASVVALNPVVTPSSGTTVYRCYAHRVGQIVSFQLQFNTTVTGNNNLIVHIDGIPKPKFTLPVVAGVNTNAALVQLTTNCDVTSGGSNFRGYDWMSFTLTYITEE